jgi:hypothetical protein
MPFFEEQDLVDMLSDTGLSVTWGTLTRRGLYRRQTEDLVDAQGVPITEKVSSVLVELAHFRDVKEGDPITVDTPDGRDWVVRQTRLEMRTLLRIFLALAA